MRGIYAITNILTDTVYYGQSEYMVKRLGAHRFLLMHGRHHNPHLQASWNKYGADVFAFASLYAVPVGDMTTREKACIDGAYAMGLRLFNICVAEPSSHVGVKRSAATRARLSVAKAGKRLSIEACVARVGKPHPHLGQSPSRETRTKLAVAGLGNTNRLGTKMSTEARTKISTSLLGNTNARGGRKVAMA